MRTLLFLSLILTSFAACRKADTADYTQNTAKTCTVKCMNIYIKPLFPVQYYSLDDIDTVLVRRYAPNGAFDSLIIEHIYNITDTVGHRNNDGHLVGYSLKTLSLTETADIEIYIPATSQSYRIWGTKDPNKYYSYDCKHNFGGCWEMVPMGEASGGPYHIGLVRTQKSGVQQMYMYLER